MFLSPFCCSLTLVQWHCWPAESSKLGTAQEQLFALAEKGREKINELLFNSNNCSDQFLQSMAINNQFPSKKSIQNDILLPNTTIRCDSREIFSFFTKIILFETILPCKIVEW